MKKVALVTGAARGIGLAIVNKFIAENYRVARLDIDAETLSKTAEALNAHDILPIEADVLQPERVQAAVVQIAERCGRLDVLVNNAGAAVFNLILETLFENWSRVLATNLSGPFCVRRPARRWC